jgi:hypothetical protein
LPGATAVIYGQIPMTVNSPTVGESSFRLNYRQQASHSIPLRSIPPVSMTAAIRIRYQGVHSLPGATAVVYGQIPMTVNSPTVGESSFRLNYRQPASNSISQTFIDSR